VADLNAAVRFSLDPHQQRDHAESDGLGRGYFDWRCFASDGLTVWNRRLDGTKTANRPPAKASGERLGQVQVIFGLSLQERSRPVSSPTPIKTKESVVVAVKDWYGTRRHDEKCSGALKKRR
jgi:hypothetical protein